MGRESLVVGCCLLRRFKKEAANVSVVKPETESQSTYISHLLGFRTANSKVAVSKALPSPPAYEVFCYNWKNGENPLHLHLTCFLLLKKPVRLEVERRVRIFFPLYIVTLL